jgi:hypothetical protein
MGKGRFVNQKLAKRTGRMQRQQPAKQATIPVSQKNRRDIMLTGNRESRGDLQSK